MKENHEGSTSEGRPFVRTFDQRRTAALAMARELSDSANLLVATSAELCNQSAELRTTAAETRGRQIRHRVLLRRRPGAEDSAWFTVCGVVDGAPRTARFWPGRLEFDDDVMDRAQVIVGMGERFALPGRPKTALDASLDGPPIAVLLTVMRAFSRVTSVDLSEEIFGDTKPKKL